MSTPANRGDQKVVIGNQRNSLTVKGYNYEGRTMGRARNDASQHYFPSSMLVAFTSRFQGTNIGDTTVAITNHELIHMHALSIAYPVTGSTDTSDFPIRNANGFGAPWTQGLEEWRQIYRIARCYATDLHLKLVWNQEIDTRPTNGMFIGAFWVPQRMGGAEYKDDRLDRMRALIVSSTLMGATVQNNIAQLKVDYKLYRWPSTLMYRKGQDWGSISGKTQVVEFDLHIDAHEAMKFVTEKETDILPGQNSLEYWIGQQDGTHNEEIRQFLGQTPNIRPTAATHKSKLGHWEIRLYTADLGSGATDAIVKLPETSLEVSATCTMTQHCHLEDNLHRTDYDQT